MKRSKTVPRLAIVIATAAALTGCTGPGDRYVSVCTDPRTGTRVDDHRCAQSPTYYGHSHAPDSGYSWYYYDTHRGGTAPRVGSRATGGTYATPRTSATSRVSRSGSVPKAGGTISRGGFGVASPASSGS